MNDNAFKLIVIVCLVAIVGILGVSAYAFINNMDKSPAVNSTMSNLNVQNASNVTNGTGNTTKTIVKTEQPKYNLITAQRAMDIVYQDSGGPNPYITLTATLYNNNGAPYYLVKAYWKDPNSNGPSQYKGSCKVDARTGVILN